MMRTTFAAFGLAMAIACSAATSSGASTAGSVAELMTQVRQLRHTADALMNAAQPDLPQAASLLERAVSELDQAEQSTGNPRLRLESYNQLIALATVYSRQGRKPQALAALDRARSILWLPAVVKLLQSDKSFDALRDEPRFKAMLASSTLPNSLWQGPATAQPYKDVLTVEERIAGLSLFWAEARQNFVYFDRVPELDWNQVYLDYLPKVMAAQTTRDYYAVMLQLAPLLHDGHTNIWAPGELNAELLSVPPVRTVLAEGRVLVRFVDDAAVRTRIRVGDEVIAIDGVAVHEYARQRVQPLVSAGSVQDRDFQIYTVGLLRGSASQPVTLRLRAADGRERTEALPRSAGYHWPEPPAFRMLADGVAYISIEHFTDDSGLNAFEAALPQILKARALVIDMRGNGGGNGDIGLKILSYLTREPITQATSYVRGDDAYLRAASGNLVNWVPLAGGAYVQRRDQVFEGPVALLTGAQTYSAGEDFAVAFRIMKRGVTLGEATGGSTGQAINFTLPGGGGARVCGKRDVFPDGEEFVGIGVMPDIEVKLTVASVRDGTDPVLERALHTLKGKP
jgi:carboxyl-terminal processing protease